LLLPENSFKNKNVIKLIRLKRWEELDLSDVGHPLLVDADRRFASGLPDIHREFSNIAGTKLFEARSQEGAAWRGIVWLDAYNDPWLIWAGTHDDFHGQQARNAIKQISNWLPTHAEYSLRARDEARSRFNHWRKQALQITLETILKASSNPSTTSTAQINGFKENDDSLVADIAVEYDSVDPRTFSANTIAEALVTIRLRINHRSAQALQDALVEVVVPFLNPDLPSHDAFYTPKGDLEIWVTMPMTKLNQLVALVDAPPTEVQIRDCTPNQFLHYVGRDSMLESIITGKATRAICGQWFIPTKDSGSPLPVCTECERQLPTAQMVQQLMRSIPHP
jgi:hypothetical protein